MVIQRNWDRTEKDDYELNVKPLIGKNEESVPLYKYMEHSSNVIIAWKIQSKYE